MNGKSERHRRTVNVPPGGRPRRDQASRKVTVWVPDDMLRELWAEGVRQERTVSHLLVIAWRRARAAIKGHPAPPGGSRAP